MTLMPGHSSAIHVVPSVDEKASGPSYTVVRLCEALIEVGENVTLAVLHSNAGSACERQAFVRSFPVRYWPRRLCISPEMHRWLQGQVNSGGSNLVHSHSLWEMPNVYPGWVTRHTGVPLIVSPRGTLSSWALNRSKWVKRVFWPLVQGPAICHAACFHATAESEYDDIRRLGFRQPVAIIPNGIDLATPRERGPGKRKKLLFLGRIHPTKGVDILLRAWLAVARRFPEWDLRIVGPDNDGYLNRMQRLAIDLAIPRVDFAGSVYGEAKARAYQEADLFVLPTHSENFGMVVAEALASGIPAIVSRGAPWQQLEVKGAGWWIDIGVDPLVACLDKALACSPANLAQRGVRGREWMEAEFSWMRVGAMMLGTYRWLREGGATPQWVKLH